MATKKQTEDVIQTEPVVNTAVTNEAPVEVKTPVVEKVSQEKPLTMVLMELLDVAEGASVLSLRKRIGEIYPRTKVEGAEFLKQLLRLRDAAETALSAGRDIQSGLDQ